MGIYRNNSKLCATAAGSHVCVFSRKSLSPHQGDNLEEKHIKRNGKCLMDLMSQNKTLLKVCCSFL